MKWAALIAWLLTAGGGFILLGIWLMRGGMRQQRETGNVIRAPLILSHFLLAAGGLVIWIIYLAVDKDALKWIAFVILVVVALLGWTMFFIWLRRWGIVFDPSSACKYNPAVLIAVIRTRRERR